MFRQPEDNSYLSLRLSEVLDDIGVNETVMKKRRRAWLLAENLLTIEHQLTDESPVFYFGSQTEGSTTLGLNSDVDTLVCEKRFEILQDLSDWEPRDKKLQFLMIRDKKTSPGYCLLQAMRPDAPLPLKYIITIQNCVLTNNRGRVLLNNSVSLPKIKHKKFRHGPAEVSRYDTWDIDYVLAYYCSKCPKEAEPWLKQQTESGWPTYDMKRQLAGQGCFLVPVASKTEVYQDVEWRISTALAERGLMFDLNVTQLRCYTLMKMILKTFIKPKCDEAISSYMCKNILLRCIANSPANSTWTECSLLRMLRLCLKDLNTCIVTENCPHFIIPNNNLLAGKLSKETTHQLVEVMSNLNENMEQSLLGISIDDLGDRLRVKCFGFSGVRVSHAPDIAHTLVVFVAMYLQSLIDTKLKHCMSKDSNTVRKDLTKYVSALGMLALSGSSLMPVASRLVTPYFYTVMGSTKASEDLQDGHDLSPEALNCFDKGLDSDVSSGKLKLASALYCAGNLERCRRILLDLRTETNVNAVQFLCCCYDHKIYYMNDFIEHCYEKNEDALKYNAAFCVRYLPSEINCIPDELKYEMFKSTKKDRPYRKESDLWIDLAVVDALPYLFFLQYKVYRDLHRPAEKYIALHNLACKIDTDPDLHHRETAWNLLGQCMKQENRPEFALYCYINSLKVRPRNNAAKWHVGILFARLISTLKC